MKSKEQVEFCEVCGKDAEKSHKYTCPKHRFFIRYKDVFSIQEMKKLSLSKEGS